MRGARRALLLAVVPFLLAPPATAHRGHAHDREVILFIVEGLSYEDALADPLIVRLARAGGIGLMTTTEPPGRVRAQAVEAARRDGFVSITAHFTGQHRAQIRGRFAFSRAQEVLVIVVGLVPSKAMEARGEIVTPVVVARGDPDVLLQQTTAPMGLTSATTNRDGLVANVDLVPTILEFVDRPIPDEVSGSPIHVSGTAPPTELLRRYLGYRGVVVPVGVIVLSLALAALAVGLAVILGPWRPPATVVRGVAVIGLFAVSLQAGMLAGSWLPDFSWPVVLGTLAGVGAVVAAVALWAGRHSSHAAVAVVAGAGLALVIVDWLLGWRSLLTPLLGGSALEGVRFYGLGNSYAGLLLAGAVLLAALGRPWAGVAVLLAAAVFAGIPWAGADLGGGITLFGASGIWWALRVRPRVGLAEFAGVAAAVLGGAALLVLLHRLAAEPSHVARAVDQAGGVGGIFGVFLDRLALNLATTARTPAVWLALAAVPAAIWVAWRRPAPFRPALEAHAGWREAVLTLGLSAVLGYALNDTYGLTAVALVYLLLALVYPALGRKNVRSKRKNVVNKQAIGLDSLT